MKLGDCYIDDYYEPDTVVIKIIEYPLTFDDFKSKVIYTSDPDRIEKYTTVTGYSDDPELIPVAMITIDDKLMIIKL